MPDPLDAYGHGAEKLDDLLDWCRQLGIPAVTLWVFSTGNFRRSAAEVARILGTVESKLARLAADRRLARLGVRLRAVGRLELLPDSMLAAIRAAEAATAANRALTLTIAIAYSGREEIADAVQALLGEWIKRGEAVGDMVESVTPEAIGRYLYAPDSPDPGLIIRTSGEVRLSGILLWQSAYSEFYFCDAHWPALRKIDFLRAVAVACHRRPCRPRRRNLRAAREGEIEEIALGARPPAAARGAEGRHWRACGVRGRGSRADVNGLDSLPGRV